MFSRDQQLFGSYFISAAQGDIFGLIFASLHSHIGAPILLVTSFVHLMIIINIYDH